MELYMNLPPSKTGSAIPAPVRAPKPAMAPVIRRKIAVKPPSAVVPRQTALEAAVAAAHRAESAAGTNADAGHEGAMSDDDTVGSHGMFPEVENEYDPWRPNSLEAILRDREAARVARQRQKELEEEEEERGEDRSRTLHPPASTSDYGRGRGLNNLPAWMRSAAAGTAAGASQLAGQPQDGSAFVGGGDNAGLGLSSSDAAVDAAQPALALPGPPPALASAAPPPATKNKALKMMAAWGYEVGKGLGKDGTGITSALEHVKTGARSGVIVSRGAPTSAAVAAAGESAAAGASRVVLLCNMAAPGDVDDDLASEVQEECSERYGAVRQCFVFECAAALGLPAEEAVRTFVQFEDAAGAERARSQLDGRFFGGRQVRASLYPEDRFLRFDLAPASSEA